MLFISAILLFGQSLKLCINLLCLFGFYVLATSKVVSGLLTLHSHGEFTVLFSLPLSSPDIAIQSHNLDTEQTSPCPILPMSHTTLDGDKCQFFKAIGFTQQSHNLPHGRPDNTLSELAILSGQNAY